jgi:poly(3-hydroxyoctanoate) depolymerase
MLTAWLKSHLTGILFGIALLTGACGSSSDAELSPNKSGQELTTSRCQLYPSDVVCTKHELSLPALLIRRKVTYEVPLGTPPAQGWPTVLYFQGSFFPGSRAFAAGAADVAGQYNLTLTVKALLDAGYAVLAPDALLEGASFWQTNVPPWSLLWTTSSDHALMLSIFQAIAEGQFGALDPSRLYAMGISSGGFMTSRMAVSYRGRFRALAVHSASYATCSALCLVPGLPADHPPTLFLHGNLDLIVTRPVMEQYRSALVRDGRSVKAVINPTAGHEWLVEGPQAITDWFNAHP